MEDASEGKLIQLEPFAHQVGGHSSMLCLDGAIVAKPLVCREQRFYETLPETLRPFVPSFHGALEVHVLQGEGGYVTHAAAPPPLYRPHLGLRTRRRIRLHDSGDIEIEGESEGMVFEDEEEEGVEQSPGKDTEEEPRVNRTARPSVGHALNPWVLRCHRESLSGLTPGTIQNFILLENLTARFKQPCVLDLKVGTRQYGDSASPAKVRSKMMKVATTTSGKIGLRLGGMQVYQVTTRRFLCRNKLFGRALTIEGFRMALVQFLHNGWHIRLDVVRPLLERLEALEGILTRLGAARFYTCSLLCLYEGELRTPSTTPLSPSTPVPPITPGPFSSMPPGSFSFRGFTFPSSPTAEGCSSVASLVNKPANNAVNGIESPETKIKTSFESRSKQSGSENLQEVNSRVSQTNLFKIVNPERILYDYFPVQENPESQIHSSTMKYVTPNHYRSPSTSSEPLKETLLVNKTTMGTSSVALGNGVNVIDHSCKPAEEGNTKIDSSYREMQYPSSPVAMHSGVTHHTSSQNLKLQDVIEGQLLKQAASMSKCITLEEQVTRGQGPVIVRSVSADSASYSKSAFEALSPKHNVDDIVNGCVKNGMTDEREKGFLKRCHSLEPQITGYDLNMFDEDCDLPCYASPSVDVRLIDFAHSTHKGLADSVAYAGPDQGFLFGLHNLINLLRDIAHEATTTLQKC